MNITLNDWKAFSNWREEQLHAIYKSEEYKKVTEHLEFLEGLRGQQITKRFRVFWFVFTWSEQPPKEILFELELDIKIAISQRQAMLDRVYPRTFEGFLDWALKA